jgi:hypothetical protein
MGALPKIACFLEPICTIGTSFPESTSARWGPSADEAHTEHTPSTSPVSIARRTWAVPS